MTLFIYIYIGPGIAKTLTINKIKTFAFLRYRGLRNVVMSCHVNMTFLTTLDLVKYSKYVGTALVRISQRRDILAGRQPYSAV